MDAMDQSAALIRRGAELRDRSMRVRAAAMETVESCRRLMEAAAAAQEAVIRAHGPEGPGARGKPCQVTGPQPGSTEGLSAAGSGQ